MTDHRRTILWLVRCVTLPLLACVVWHGTPGIVTAFHYRLPSLAMLYVLVAAGLVVSGFFADVIIRRNGIALSRIGVLVFLIACACSLALGKSPGAFLSPVYLSVFAAVVLALFGAAASGPRAAFGSRAILVWFAFVVGAAWQVGAAPVIATILVRS